MLCRYTIQQDNAVRNAQRGYVVQFEPAKNDFILCRPCERDIRALMVFESFTTSYASQATPGLCPHVLIFKPEESKVAAAATSPYVQKGVSKEVKTQLSHGEGSGPAEQNVRAVLRFSYTLSQIILQTTLQTT